MDRYETRPRGWRGHPLLLALLFIALLMGCMASPSWVGDTVAYASRLEHAWRAAWDHPYP